MMSPLEELIEYVFENDLEMPAQDPKELLVKNDLNEDQWTCFKDLLEDLELNKQGATLLLSEIKSGRVLFPTR